MNVGRCVDIMHRLMFFFDKFREASPMSPAPWLLARWVFAVWFWLLNAQRLLARWFLDVSFQAHS